MNIYIHENMKQVTRIRYKTEDNPPMANVPLIGYSKKYDCWVALVYRKGDNYYTNMECDVEYKTSPPDVKIDWKLLRAIEEGEVEIDNEKYHLSGIEYVAKRYQDMFYAGRDIYYFKGIGGHGMTDLLRNAIDDLLDTISSREAYRSAEHRMYAQMNQLTEAGAMISLAIELLTSNIRHSYGEINFERYPRPVEVEGEDKH